MKQNYTKKTENYNDNLFFDNDIYENEANLPQFNLERPARNAAQQMIQSALESEVTEFLERSKYTKCPQVCRKIRLNAEENTVVKCKRQATISVMINPG